LHVMLSSHLYRRCSLKNSLHCHPKLPRRLGQCFRVSRQQLFLTSYVIDAHAMPKCLTCSKQCVWHVIQAAEAEVQAVAEQTPKDHGAGFKGKKSKAAAKQGTAKRQWEILRDSGIPESEISEFRWTHLFASGLANSNCWQAFIFICIRLGSLV